MCLKDAMFEFEHFRRLGLNVMIPEFVGYGMSAGKPSETGCRETADAAFAHLQGRKDINPKKVVAAGWSLGGAVAVDLAARKPVAGLIAFSTFTSMAEMSRRSFPFLPATLLLRHRFDSEAKMSHITCPMLLGHGRKDEIVPAKMLDRLAAAANKAPVMKFIVDDAGHNDFYAVGQEQIFQAMGRFLGQFTPSPEIPCSQPSQKLGLLGSIFFLGKDSLLLQVGKPLDLGEDVRFLSRIGPRRIGLPGVRLRGIRLRGILKHAIHRDDG